MGRDVFGPASGMSKFWQRHKLFSVFLGMSLALVGTASSFRGSFEAPDPSPRPSTAPDVQGGSGRRIATAPAKQFAGRVAHVQDPPGEVAKEKHEGAKHGQGAVPHVADLKGLGVVGLDSAEQDAAERAGATFHGETGGTGDAAPGAPAASKGGVSSPFSFAYAPPSSGPASFRSGVEPAAGPVGKIPGQQTSSGPVLMSAVPEPATWLMLILGFGAVGYALRRQRVIKAARLAAHEAP